MRKSFLLFSMLLLFVCSGAVIAQDEDNQPDSVTIAGTIQALLGCEADWLPGCEITDLQYDDVFDLWTNTFDLPAGNYEYKVAINGGWTENYGGFADQDGPNVVLDIEEDASVTFIYDHKSNWVADSVNHVIANVPGSFQSELGCPSSMGASGDWAPECLISWLQDPDGDGVYIFVTDAIPAGSYEAKVAVNGSWTENYGAGGALDGPNIPFDVAADGDPIAFIYSTIDNQLFINNDGSIAVASLASTNTGGDVIIEGDVRPVDLEQPDMVVVAGTIQSVLGCSDDWQPECAATSLSFDESNGIWRGQFEVPAGDYEYKAAIGSWEENYGANAEADGANIPLSLAEDTTVEFYYDHHTHWIADSINHAIVTAPGSYQLEIGCSDALGAGGDWAPECLLSWMQDPDGDGIYVFSTDAIPAGDYEMKVAVGLSWDVNYGAGGSPGGANIPFAVEEDGTVVTFAFNAQSNEIYIGIGEPIVIGQVASINLDQSRAHWVSADTILWDGADGEDVNYALYYSADATLQAGDGAIAGGDFVQLIVNDAGVTSAIDEKFPHLSGKTALQLSEDDLQTVPDMLRGQVIVAAFDGDRLLNATGVQIPGVLDDLYTYDGDLGLIYDGDVPTIRVWAPTAQSVKLHLFADSSPDTESDVLEMERDDMFGVWSIEGEPGWTYQYYLFEVTVYAPSVQRIVTNLVTDPYSVSLSQASQRSQIVDLANDTMLMPDGWQGLEKPQLDKPEDIVIYELHIRDFSVNDPLVPDELKGTFAALTVDESNGLRHLRSLAEAGLTHIHMLPLFDIATINENAAERVEADPDQLAQFAPDSDEQAALLNSIRDQDAFNWGYDPLHYNVPEGSYSTNPDGTQRIVEFRQMVQALNENGLRVVMDVVYNHTNASGQGENSVLDRVVPGYYHRLTDEGFVQTSTCCQNTATEHNMMRKLMVDSIILWSTAYKVDGFRFDLMGHHMLSDMQAVQDAVNALTMDEHGVDGSSIYIYGEGWDFGEVANNARGTNATQLNIPGTGIGVFNDRLRDAARGGSPVRGDERRWQGFSNGLWTFPNGVTGGDEDTQFERLLLFGDQIRIGLAGNLADYTFEGREGEIVRGTEIPYGGAPAGYTVDPQENIVYVAAHDNETLWDAIQLKAPESATVDDRVRMNNLAVSITALSQGVPFFHAGDDLLRSKSIERDSYNAGDWFNRIDFTYQTNYWGIGLPPIGQEAWDDIRPLIGDSSLAVTPDQIMAARRHFLEMLRIRQSSPLFRLETGDAIQQRVRFHNTGPDQVPGVILMSIHDDLGEVEQIDEMYAQIVVVFNGRNETVTIGNDTFAGQSFELHAIQENSHDTVVHEAAFNNENGTFSVPAFTTAVFVINR